MLKSFKHVIVNDLGNGVSNNKFKTETFAQYTE